MKSFKLRAAADERLRADEVALLFQFRFFLVGKNAQARFSVDHFESDGAEKESVDHLVVIDGGNKNRAIQATDEFALEQGRIGGLMISPGVQDLARSAHGATEVERSVLLPITDQARFIDSVDNGIRAEGKQGRSILRQLRGSRRGRWRAGRA